MPNNTSPLTLMISAADDVTRHVEEFHDHLHMISPNGQPIKIWREPEAGKNIEEEFRSTLEHASVALVLISAKYLSDNTIRCERLPKIIEKAKSDQSFILLWFEANPTMMEIAGKEDEQLKYLLSMNPLLPQTMKFYEQPEEQQKACIRDMAMTIDRVCIDGKAPKAGPIARLDITDPIQIGPGHYIYILYNGKVQTIPLRLPEWEDKIRSYILKPKPWKELDKLIFPFLYPRIRDAHVLLEKFLILIAEATDRTDRPAEADEYLREVEALLSAAAPHAEKLLDYLNSDTALFLDQLKPLFFVSQAVVVAESCLGSRDSDVIERSSKLLSRVSYWLLEAHRCGSAVAERTR